MKSKKETTSRNGFLLCGPDVRAGFEESDGWQPVVSGLEYGRDLLFYEDLLPYFQFWDQLQKISGPCSWIRQRTPPDQKPSESCGSSRAVAEAAAPPV